MAAKISKATRQWCESFSYKLLDILDPTHKNTNKYKELISKMSDDEYYEYISRDFPYVFFYKDFEVDPDIETSKKALDLLKIPLLEPLNLPYLYQNKDGIPVQSKPCLRSILSLRKVQQFITKKNSMSTDIKDRDMNTGLLGGHDKNGKESDREMEALASMGLYNTMKEFGTIRADSMKAKNLAYNIINTKGQLSLKEVQLDPDDSLSRKLMDTYLIGSLLKSNIINDQYYTYYTLQEKKRKTIQRA